MTLRPSQWVPALPGQIPQSGCVARNLFQPTERGRPSDQSFLGSWQLAHEILPLRKVAHRRRGVVPEGRLADGPHSDWSDWRQEGSGLNDKMVSICSVRTVPSIRMEASEVSWHATRIQACGFSPCNNKLHGLKGEERSHDLEYHPPLHSRCRPPESTPYGRANLAPHKPHQEFAHFLVGC